MAKCVIRTFTGLEVNPLDLRKEDIRIEDIAHALALCNRFAGHTRWPVSVAQHSVYVSVLSSYRCVHRVYCTHRRVSLQGLLHDAAEAYLGDVTKWLKNTDAMAAYREAEDRALTTILRRFDCGEGAELYHEVERADRLMVRIEGERGFGPDFRIDHPEYLPTNEEERRRVGPWRPWTWRMAERRFLERFKYLWLGQSSAST